MATMNNSKLNQYEKHHSFSSFHSNHDVEDISMQSLRASRILSEFCLNNSTSKYTSIYKVIIDDLNAVEAGIRFKVTPFIADEMAAIDDLDLPRYLYHRYRYDIHPQKNILDDYPPYLQIEPTSVCNFRCVFCYQTDDSFNKKQNGFMGNMKLDMYKNIVDQIEGNVEFLSLASRGEPLLCKEFPAMLEYSIDKFLNLKVNTNASLLTERLCHDLLNGAVQTLVFSADAAEEPLYSQMRVNGKLDKVLSNIKMFQTIKEKYYSNSRIITRVSGVMFDRRQSMESMINLWSNLVDQVSFVKYNPWENIYETDPNEINTPCSDLWRRMFIWFDGKVNPCDSDYKSELCVGNILDGQGVSQIWRSGEYANLRIKHAEGKRQSKEPCRRCSVV